MFVFYVLRTRWAAMSGSPESQASPPLGEGKSKREPGLWVPLPCPLFSGSWVPLLQAVGGGPESWAPPQLEGRDHSLSATASLLTVATSISSQEARVGCAMAPVATGFSAAMGPAAAARDPCEQGCSYCLHCSPFSTHFKYTDV